MKSSVHQYKFTLNYKDGSFVEYERELTDRAKYEHQLELHKLTTVRSVAVERLS